LSSRAKPRDLRFHLTPSQCSRQQLFQPLANSPWKRPLSLLSLGAEPRDLRFHSTPRECYRLQLFQPLANCSWKRPSTLVIPSEAEGPAVPLNPRPMQSPATLSATSELLMEAPLYPCHPERSRGTCGSTQPQADAVAQQLFQPLANCSMEEPPHPCHPERSRGTCGSTQPQADAVASNSFSH
jgi:hypothetical protein